MGTIAKTMNMNKITVGAGILASSYAATSQITASA